jgi:hypothetical protein
MNAGAWEPETKANFNAIKENMIWDGNGDSIDVQIISFKQEGFRQLRENKIPKNTF